MSVWLSEGEISGTGEEHGPDRNAVRAGQSLDGAQDAVKRNEERKRTAQVRCARTQPPVAVQRRANDDAIFTRSVSVRNPKQKTGCSDLPFLCHLPDRIFRHRLRPHDSKFRATDDYWRFPIFLYPLLAYSVCQLPALWLRPIEPRNRRSAPLSNQNDRFPL